MKYHLERGVRLSIESEYENLYKWSLQEHNENGKQIGENQIPWAWSLHFTASELRHIRSIEYGKLYDSDEEGKKGISEQETITGILHSGLCNDGKQLEDYVHYSLFGTNRIIKQFGLRIYKLDDASDDEEDKEDCWLSGFASYTTEMDFRDETTEDFVEIILRLSPERFDKLSELITLKRVDRFRLFLGQVSGFYSEWSPDILTHNIKILPRDSDKNVVVIPENCKIEPPRLGEVGEFSLSITQRNVINLKQDLQGVDINKIFEDE